MKRNKIEEEIDETTPYDVIVYSSLNCDFGVKLNEDFAKPGETVFGNEMVKSLGGKGYIYVYYKKQPIIRRTTNNENNNRLNSAVAIARMGGKVLLIGCIGSDGEGEFLLEGLKNEGIKIDYIKKKNNIGTGVAFILVNKQGENMITVVGGANREKEIMSENELRVVLKKGKVRRKKKQFI